jgi:hypothetical protein
MPCIFVSRPGIFCPTKKNSQKRHKRYVIIPKTLFMVTSGRPQKEITEFSGVRNYLYRWHNTLEKTVQILEPTGLQKDILRTIAIVQVASEGHKDVLAVRFTAHFRSLA